MADSPVLHKIIAHRRGGGRLTLLLDYDGTLVPIAPTPDEALPDNVLLDLLKDLTGIPMTDTIILSGRPLESLRSMLPIPGLILAGTYGLELQRGDGVSAGQAPEQIRPIIARIQASWRELIDGRDGFLLEDKGLAVALHAALGGTQGSGHGVGSGSKVSRWPYQR